MITRVHVLVGNNVMAGAGRLRTKGAQATGSSVAYAPASVISQRLDDLIVFINNSFAFVRQQPQEQQLRLVLFLGSYFFSQFLLIHPFSDGNGRTARLLLSMLLRGYTIVPVSLYYMSDRSKYIGVLEERRSGESMPWALIVYLAHCALDTAEKALSAPDEAEQQALDAF